MSDDNDPAAAAASADAGAVSARLQPAVSVTSPPLVVPCAYGEGGNGSSSESGGGGGFTKLEVVVNVPPANTTVNGTALQLRLAPLRNSRGWGARVWLGSAAIHEITEEE